MSGAVRLGRIFGVPVVADSSVFVLMLAFATAVFLNLLVAVPSVSAEQAGIAALLAGIGIVASLLLHEYGHVIVAARRGLKVRQIRLTMFGGTSEILGPPTPRTEALVAAIGPATSLVIGFVCMAFATFAGTLQLIGATFWTLGLANVAIGIVNLLPGFPLDGGRILRSLLGRRGMGRAAATRVVTGVGRLLGFVALGVGTVLLVLGEVAGLFWILGGWFLASTAQTAGRREALRVAFEGLTLADVMRETHDSVPGRSTVSDMLSLYGVGSRLRALPVESTGRVVGVIGQEEVDSISPSRWPSARVSSIMTPIGPSDVHDADAPIESLLLRPSGATSRVIVARHGVTVGIIEGKDLAKILE